MLAVFILIPKIFEDVTSVESRPIAKIFSVIVAA